MSQRMSIAASTLEELASEEHVFVKLLREKSAPGSAETLRGLAEAPGGPDMAERTCSVAGCARKHYANGLCHGHYARGRRTGTLGPATFRSKDGLWGKVEKGAPDECWEFTGSRSTAGYGQVRINRRSYPAHRVAYIELVGPIPDGLFLDHLCRNPACVNPAHLEPVTNRENVLRGVSPVAVNARKTTCKRGHPLTAENVYTSPKGYRECRQCKRGRQRGEF